jgi:hypothetical protein
MQSLVPDICLIIEQSGAGDQKEKPFLKKGYLKIIEYEHIDHFVPHIDDHYGK